MIFWMIMAMVNALLVLYWLVKAQRASATNRGLLKYNAGLDAQLSSWRDSARSAAELAASRSVLIDSLRKELKESYQMPRHALEHVGSAIVDMVEYPCATFPELRRIRFNRDCAVKDRQVVQLFVAPV